MSEMVNRPADEQEDLHGYGIQYQPAEVYREYIAQLKMGYKSEVAVSHIGRIYRKSRRRIYEIIRTVKIKRK